MSLITLVRTSVVAILMVACAPRALPLTAEHPAHPDAEPGRFEGPPSPLRPGVAMIDEPTRDNSPATTSAAPVEELPVEPATMKPAKPAKPATKPASAPKKAAPKKPAPKTPAPKTPAPKTPAPKTPAPKTPAPHPPGHEGHH